LKPDGRMILEVPRQTDKPFSCPSNPYHKREYELEQLVDLVQESGFKIESKLGNNRGFYGSVETARNAYQFRMKKI